VAVLKGAPRLRRLTLSDTSKAEDLHLLQDLTQVGGCVVVWGGGERGGSAGSSAGFHPGTYLCIVGGWVGQADWECDTLHLL
jgi:hypothetical protein